MELAKIAIVGFYLSINALLLIWLAVKVIGVRQKKQISIGDGDSKSLAYKIRGHGNASEYMPIFFLLMGAAALLQTPAIALHFFGAFFTLGRALHAAWFLNPSQNLKPRLWGMMMTFFAIVVLAVGLLAHAVVIMAGGYG